MIPQRYTMARENGMNDSEFLTPGNNVTHNAGDLLGYNVSHNDSSSMGTAVLAWELFVCERVSEALNVHVTPVICLLGLLGNMLNIAVLTRRRLYHSLEHLERSALTGLLALAVSDLLFCISVLPHAFQDRQQFSSATIDFWLVYNTYSGAVINTWLLCSAWITVALAVCRYLAVCRPLYARSHSCSTGRIVSIIALASIILNLPRYGSEVITFITAPSGQRFYFAMNGPLRKNETVHVVYMWLYFMLGIVGPLLILTYCTRCLILALRHSQLLRRRHSSSTTASTSSTSRNMLTATLCAVVICYVILVAPAEVVNFAHYFIKQHFSHSSAIRYSLAVSLCNTLQAVNFSFNFILYCSINMHFRKVALGLLSCLLPKQCRPDMSAQAQEMSLIQDSCTATTG